MTHPAVSAPANAGTLGLIDTLQAGFNVVNHHLWLLLLPLLVDLHLWLGPQLTIGTALGDWASKASTATSVAGTVERFLGAGDVPSGSLLDPGEELRQYNLFWLLTIPFLGIPSFRAGAPGSGSTVPMDSLPAVVVASTLILTIGFSLTVVFYGLLAQVIRTGRAHTSSFAEEFGVLWVRAVALFFMTTGALLGIAVPIAFLVAGTIAAAPALLTLVASLILGVGVWIFVHLFFTADALFVGIVGPMTAIRRSIAVVRHFFWESVLFVGLIVIISSGFPIILHELAHNLHAAGMVLAILGHIYISASVIAASMTYYRERFERLQTSLTR